MSNLSNVRGYVESVRLHRFRDCVAVSILRANDGGSGRPVQSETVYLSEDCARALARRLLAAVTDIRDFPEYSKSEFRSVTIDDNGDKAQG